MAKQPNNGLAFRWILAKDNPCTLPPLDLQSTWLVSSRRVATKTKRVYLQTIPADKRA
jgi:hypothetical protein